MTALQILTVDDEQLALKRLQLLLRNIPGIEQVGQASSCGEAHDEIARTRPDIILLDIRMRDGTGFDVIERLPTGHAPLIIFVSAFDEFAVRAFEASVIDYVLKPVEFDRLQEAIERARLRLAETDAVQQLEQMRLVVAGLRANMREDTAPRYETEFWIRKSVTGYSRVAVDNIDWVSSEDDYVRVHTSAASYLMRGSIRGLEARLDPNVFTRIHRRTLVRTDAIRELHNPRFGNLEVILYTGQRLTSGRVYAKQLRRMIAERLASGPGGAKLVG